MSLALIDYGAGNLRSVENALREAGATDLTVTADPDVIIRAERIVLPGVGAFGACIGALRAIDGMVAALEEAALTRAKPFLGICVGMQLMAETGEELGTHHGLGWIAGTVAPLLATRSAKVPHMGWNDVMPHRPHPLIQPGEAYFLHGFAVSDTEADVVLAVTDHGGPLTAAVGRDNLIGVQFHPEKSQSYGLAFLEKFLKWRP